MTATGPQTHCEDDCGTIVETRNRYFTGKPMTARDFTDEQRYLVERHRLHNRLLHDWGVVCGLRVKYHRNPDCRDRWVEVEPGIAIDCCGREIVVGREEFLRIGRVDTAEQPDADAGEEPERWRPREDLVVYARYAEDLQECLPVLYDEHGCDPVRTEPGRIRERAEIRVARFADLPDGCWSQPDGSSEPCHKGCGEDQWDSRGCLEPACPCGSWVPLARLTVADAADYDGTGAFRIDDSGVRRLPPPSQHLTRIVEINWDHGGQMPIKRLHDDGLRVRFDRPLDPPECVNRFTFVVQYSGSQDDLEFVAPAQHSPSYDEDTCTAVFRVADELLNRRNFPNSDIYVSLRCDFLVDCNGLAVDGDHIAGRLPTGNGNAGGAFESWFYLE